MATNNFNQVRESFKIANPDFRMNETNVLLLFKSSISDDIHHFLQKLARSSCLCLFEAVNWYFLELLHNNEFENIEQIISVLKFKYNVTDQYCLDVLKAIINDFNQYYLNDEFYYGGYPNYDDVDEFFEIDDYPYNDNSKEFDE